MPARYASCVPRFANGVQINVCSTITITASVARKLAESVLKNAGAWQEVLRKKFRAERSKERLQYR